MRIVLLLPVFLFACQPPLPEEPPTTVHATPTTAPTPTTTSTKNPEPTVVPEKTAPSEELEAAFVPELLAIAAEYESYGRADDFFHWAPYMCALPMATRPGAHVSASADDGTHGQKIYSLFAGLRGKTPVSQPTLPTLPFQQYSSLIPMSAGQKVYLDVAKGKAVPDGLALVKESWRPEEVTDPTEADRIRMERRVIESQHAPGEKGVRPGSKFWPYAEKDGVLFHTKEKAGLFVMYKMPEETPGTDEGWVYGTLSADGKTVTSSGKVSSCMGCHTRAPYGRLFIDKKSGEK